MEEAGETVAAIRNRGLWATMRGILLNSLVAVFSSVMPPQTGASGNRPLSSSIEMGNIPERPIAPEFAFERFSRTRPLHQL